MPEQDHAHHQDQRYIQGILANDGNILEEIYRLFLPRIITLIQKNSGSKEDALDIFQEAIIVVYKKTKTDNLVITQSFYNYLYTVSRNLWMRELTKRKNQRVTFNDLSIEAAQSMMNESLEIDRLIGDREAHKLYMEKFLELGQDCQKILQSFFEGKEMRSIARLMGFASEGYAKKRKHVCQKKLIKAIKEDPRYKGSYY